MLRTEMIVPVHELLRRHAEERPKKLAYRDQHVSINYGELEAASATLAGHLMELGVARGDCVAIWLPNSVHWIVACFAVVRAGGISVPISYEASTPEASYRLEDARCKILVTTDEKLAQLKEAKLQLPTLKTTIVDDRGPRQSEGLRYADLLKKNPAKTPRDPDDIDAPAFIVYTSGTTGRAKGVILTLRGMLWIVAACWAPITGLSEKDYVLSPLPLFHSYALNLSVLGILATGASEYILEKYSTADCLRLLRSEPFTIFPGVPTMFHYLLEAAGKEGAMRFPSLRLCISAGAIMPATLNREFEKKLNVPLLDGYGITETSTMVTMNWPVGGRVLGSCGLPVPGVMVRIVNPATELDVNPGEEGELIVRGPNVMLGYHEKPTETAAALKNGWYRTGDLAKSDANGFLTITGRLKELIIRGGQNIAPAEIEEVANTHEAVLDCAVIGVAHEKLGEVPVIFVVARPGAKFEPDALLAHCKAKLSAYKVPQAVHMIGQIPRTGSGKIMRFKLREALPKA
ncbi:MAG TPA: AMP-binding protein [Xanthobacteraceae bacterium]|nr:AMP-binding protein [Xanthobacteraceae bacterium]